MFKKIKVIINLLKNKRATISVAESCTGGMLAQHLTSVSGASKVFKFGIIAYSNQSKIKHLKVPFKLLKEHGAVSKECCHSMLYNLSKISKAKINISTTGIAGPSGGSKLKPVGLVYIGIQNKKKIIIQKFQFKNKGRLHIQRATVKKSIDLILNSIR